jgi:hypothetical protein
MTRRGGAAATSRLAQDNRTHMHKYQVPKAVAKSACLHCMCYYVQVGMGQPSFATAAKPWPRSRTVIRI